MVEVSVLPYSSRDSKFEETTYFDPEPGSEFRVPLIGGETECVVTITHIYWESVVEVESFVVNTDAVIKPFTEVEQSPTILVIGDSISCGYTEPDWEPIPRGCLDAFPFQAKRFLEQGPAASSREGTQVHIELVAYPGISLVEPIDDEGETMSFCMLRKFFHRSSGRSDNEHWDIKGSPVVIAIALGTNDKNYCVSADQFEEALKEFIRKLRNNFVTVRQFWLFVRRHASLVLL
ncbi:hypothetical protein HYDPIDRAFT_29786 [Hydnomerulius pinastri MD-312]|uniref:SGNH hydrolase-type esterase domain-containing protein n=1 Tax=Hydnomerulius pinastri MD-312 TaxID=994086 RepID=A0A0C9WE71_9AGAM|nr:hypothetical protein HYDPIDRAFT_29786 [Hydnomerulius pinastri MD-312]